MSTVTLQEAFVEKLPHMRRIARLAFLNLDPEKRAEAVSNTIALCWKAWHRLGELGRASEPGILKAIVWFSVKQTKAGRTCFSASKPRDPLALRVYGKVKFEPWNLADYISDETPVPEQVIFRVDVRRFLKEVLTERQRNLALDLAAGMTTGEAAKKYNRTPGAISQFRTRFKLLFDRFFEE